MPPLPAVNHVLKMSYRGEYAGHPWAAVMHAQYTGADLSQALLDGFTVDAFNHWDDHLCPVQSVASTLQELVVSDLTASNPIDSVATGNGPGGRAGTALPPSIACCISWTIAARYRGGHPRTYLAGMSETDTFTVTTFTSGYLAAVLAGAAAFRTAINAMIPAPGETIRLGAVSYYTNNALRPVPLFREFVGQRVNERIDHQRRRDGR